MKLRNIIPALVAGLTMLVSCNDDEATYLDSVRVSQSIVSLPVEGGDTAITVNANSAWEFKNVPDWLKLSKTTGEAGLSEVKFSAEATATTREAIIKLMCAGDSQLIKVMQSYGKVELPISTCADVNANGAGKTVRVKGICTSIANTTYGNWYISDGTGEVYIYGTLDASGAEKNFASLGIEVGDIIDVEGPAKLYNGTMELVNVTVNSIEKSLVKVDSVYVNDEKSDVVPAEGGKVTVFLTCKGNGVDYTASAENESILSIRSISTKGTQSVYTFNVAKNEGGDRVVSLEFNTTDNNGKQYSAPTKFNQKGSIIAGSCKEFNAAEKGTNYRLSGVVVKMHEKNANCYYIRDWSGDTVYVYNAKAVAIPENIKAGSIVTVVGTRDAYKETIEMTNSTVEDVKEVAVATVAEMLAKEDNTNAYFMVTGKIGKIANENYGNLDLVDETGTIYVYGLLSGYGATGDAKKGFIKASGLKEGDTITLIGYKTTHNGNAQIGGAFFWNKAVEE
ncbi:MAG: DNA-binding protein [Bacteroidaceae bacterium]|nr:DNA-binding protein [Bacteroidaceae bacterium]